MEIRDRIKEFKRVPASLLMANPLNHRIHPEAQRKQLRSVLKNIGFAGALLAREQDGQLLLLDGHLRAQEAGNTEVPVLVLDVNEVEGNQILATYDALGAMAESDKQLLAELTSTFTDDPFAETTSKREETIFKTEEEEAAEKEAERTKDVERYTKGGASFNPKVGQWWRVADARFIYCGSHKDEAFLNALDSSMNEGVSADQYHTVFVHAPSDDPDDYRTFEQFLDRADECWTLWNGNGETLSYLTAHRDFKRIYSFSSNGECQLAVFHSRKHDGSFIQLKDNTETKLVAKTSDYEKAPDPNDGSVVKPFCAGKLIGAMRTRALQHGKVIKFIIPKINTGRLFSIVYNGVYCRSYMAEPNPELMDAALKYAYANPLKNSNTKRGKPPEIIKKWTMASLLPE